MAPPKYSILVPVNRTPELTVPCLASLRRSLSPDETGECEVILADNANSAATTDEIARIGRTLFADRFMCLRQDSELGVSALLNRAAERANGEYLVFLDNSLIAMSGWLTALAGDFAEHPGLGASAATRVYKSDSPAGPFVDYLGSFVSLDGKPENIYRGVPLAWEYVKKRRFFQTVSGRCLLMPRKLFESLGGFNENYTRAFEDTDLTARLHLAGYRLTVNPSALCVVNDEYSAPSGAFYAPDENLFKAEFSGKLTPDLHLLSADDGFSLRLTPWLHLLPEQAGRPGPAPSTFSGMSIAELRKTVVSHPFAEEAHMALAHKLRQAGLAGQTYDVLRAASMLRPEADLLMSAFSAAIDTRSQKNIEEQFINLFSEIRAFDSYLLVAEKQKELCEKYGIDSLAEQYDTWLKTAENFYSELYLPLMRKARDFSENVLSPGTSYLDYAIWRELAYSPRIKAGKGSAKRPGKEIGISVIMPVYNPKLEHLHEAVESVFRQSHDKWELCIADDCSTDPEVLDYLKNLQERDKRVKVAFRTENGHISRSSNTALELAGYEFCALMDQDDLITDNALETVAEAIFNNPRGMLFYSDEDKINEQGNYREAYLKPDWDASLICCQNYVSHLSVYNTARLRQINGFRPGLEGSQDYDLLLRFVDGLPAESIVHIPEILYHWRIHSDSTAFSMTTKPYVFASTVKAIEEYLAKSGVQAKVGKVPGCSFHRPYFLLPSEKALVSIIIHADENTPGTDPIRSLSSNTSYGNIEFVIVHDENQPESLKDHLASLANKYGNVRVLTAEPGTSWGQKSNQAAAAAHGKLLGFIEQSVRPISKYWLEYLAGQLLNRHVGACGAKIVLQDETVHNTGYDCDGTVLSANYRYLHCDAIGPGAMNKLTRKVATTDPRLLFCRRETFNQLSGFDESMNVCAAVDFCLRLPQRGLSAIVDPLVIFSFVKDFRPEPWENDGRLADAGLMREWADKLPSFHPYLKFAKSNLTYSYDI